MILFKKKVSWQLGLNEREINQIIRGDTSQEKRVQVKNAQKAAANTNEKTSTSNGIEQRPITESDVCPICQDELLAKKLPVSFCR